MERTHDGRHGPDCFGCRIGDGPYLSAKATPSRTPSKATARVPGNSWERGIATDGRGLPITGTDGQPLGVKQLADDRHRIEKRLAEVKDPSYWASRTPASTSS